MSARWWPPTGMTSIPWTSSSQAGTLARTCVPEKEGVDILHPSSRPQIATSTSASPARTLVTARRRGSGVASHAFERLQVFGYQRTWHDCGRMHVRIRAVYPCVESRRSASKHSSAHRFVFGMHVRPTAGTSCKCASSLSQYKQERRGTLTSGRGTTSSTFLGLLQAPSDRSVGTCMAQRPSHSFLR